MKTIDAVELLINNLRYLVPARVLLAGPTLCRTRAANKHAFKQRQRSGTRRAAGMARCAGCRRDEQGATRRAERGWASKT
eukprot:1981929-Pleurochrysis_carterae.AAC.1